jgi:hypothetical protein
MSGDPDSPQDALYKEYSQIFRDFDELTLARWMAQTLGQLEGKVWRQSHPLIGAYRLAAQVAHENQIWLKRLANAPAAYAEAPCCRAPALPLLTRDVRDTGLICEHCAETLLAIEDVPGPLRAELESWAAEYGPVHAVAHWDDQQRKSVGDYNRAFENAAKTGERLLAVAGRSLAVKLLDLFPAVAWEDEDDCLEVRPEDVVL